MGKSTARDGSEPTLGREAVRGELPSGLPRRDRVGPYVLQGVLGGGGMGLVHQGVGPDGQLVAIKTIHPAFLTPELLERFEVESLVRLDHPNVIRVLGAGRDPEDGTPYLVLELLEGESLDRRLLRGNLAPDELVDYFTGACEGLAAVHDAGILHRDLKPANLFRTRDGEVKLLDFGVARVGAGPKLTAKGDLLGTLSYLSPEQARGDLDLDPRADIWSLGAVLYEAIAGHPPFERESALGTILAIINERPRPLEEVAPSLPRPLATVVGRALSRRREDRWPSALALRDALEGTRGAPSVYRQTGVPPPRPDEQLIPEAERRVATVLLARGVGDLTKVKAAIEDAGGQPVPFLGEGMAGVFGVDRWVGDEAYRAVRVALACRGLVERVAVGSGNLESHRGWVAGEPLRAAERACRTDEAAVTVDAETARMVRGVVHLSPIDDGLWSVDGLGRGTLGGQGPLDDAPIAARDDELDTLGRWVREEAATDGSSVLVLSGPLGIGKTRLRVALQSYLLEHFAEDRSLATRGDPLHPDRFLNALGALLRGRIASREDPRGGPPERKLEAELRAVLGPGRAGEDAVAYLGQLLELPIPSSEIMEPARQDPQLLSDLTMNAMEDYLRGLRRQGPLALVVEDAQWVDESSLELLRRAVDAPLTHRFALVLVTRDGDALASRFLDSRVHHLSLTGLPVSAVQSLAASLAGTTLDPTFLRRLTDQVDGNPLFVEQIVLALQDQGLFDEDETPADLPLPVTVEAAVQERLRHLDDAQKAVCRTAAVLGRPFLPVDLESLGVAPLVDPLVERGILVAGVRDPRSDTITFDFRNRLLADVAYRMIGDGMLTTIHGQVADYLTQARERDPAEVARHLDAAGREDEALGWYVEAARAAAARSDSRGVLVASERALAIGVPDASTRFTLRLGRADALRFLGRRKEQEAELGQATREAGDSLQRARSLSDYVAVLVRVGRGRQASAMAEAAVRAAVETEDPDVLAMALGRRAEALMASGRLRDAEASLAEARAIDASLTPWTSALLAEFGARLATLSGDIGAAIDGYARAAAAFRDCGDLRRAAANEVNLADRSNRVGAYEAAEAALRSGLANARRVQNRIAEAYATVNLAYAVILQGRIDEGLELVDDARRLAREVQDGRLDAWACLYRTQGLVHAGEVEAGRSSAAETAAAAEATEQPEVVVQALVWGAEAALLAGDSDSARDQIGRALAFRADLESMEEGEAQLYLTAMRVLLARQDPTGAAWARSEGLRVVDLQASRIRDRERRRHFLMDVGAHRTLRG